MAECSDVPVAVTTKFFWLPTNAFFGYQRGCPKCYTLLLTKGIVQICKLINILRKEEKGEEAIELRHANLIRSIESEIESLKNLEIAELNFELGSYIDSQNQIRPCYILNDEGILQMLNKESAIVRYKTAELIEGLKEENKQLKQQLQKEVIECKYIHSERKFIHLICVYTYLPNGKEEKGEEAIELRHANLMASIRK